MPQWTPINIRITELENTIERLNKKIADLSANTEEKFNKPTTFAGGIRGQAITSPIDFKTGMSGTLGNGVIFNDSELIFPPSNAVPPLPTKGYNKHSHTRYSGGALIKGAIEIVEYKSGVITNYHSQRFYNLTEEDIEPIVNTKGETVKKIGLLDLSFNADTGTWGCTANEIDVKKCFFVQRDENGDIELDSKGQEKKSPLYNTDTTKTSILWDESGNCWRLLAVYAEGS